MPFALAIIGIFLLVAAVRGTADGPNGLFALVAGDFTGPSSFVYWMVAILIIGALGYIPKVKPISTAMLGLVVLVLFLSKGDPSKAGGGFFEKFTAGLATTATAKPAAAGAPAASGSTTTAQQAQGVATQIAPATNALGGLINQLDTFGNDVSGWIN